MGKLGDLLESAEKKKIVMVMSSRVDNNMNIEGHGGLMTNPDIQIVKFDDLVDRKSGMSNQYDLLPDVFLMQNPYDKDHYVPIEDSLKTFSSHKHYLISEFCQLLGCSQFEVSQLDIVSKRKTTSLKIRADHKFAEGDFSGLSEDEQKFVKRFEFVDDYPGGEPNKEKARQLLDKNGLKGDFYLESLLNKRSNADNPLQKHTIHVSLTNETEKTLEIVLNVKIPKIGLKVSPTFNKKKFSKTEYSVDYTVTF